MPSLRKDIRHTSVPYVRGEKRRMTREEAIHILKNTALLGTEEQRKKVEEALSTIDAVKHGAWIPVDWKEPRRYGCSECHRLVWQLENYCPNCGAYMRGENNADPQY